MKLVIPIVALSLSACGNVPTSKVLNLLDGGIDKAIAAGEFAQSRVVETSLTGAAAYCRIPQSRREQIRAEADQKADANPDTAGIRLRIGCPDDASE